MKDKPLPWWYRLDEALHRTIDIHLGRRPWMWRLVYTGPRWWFCRWADRRMERQDLIDMARIAKSMCIEPILNASTSSNSTTVVVCGCPKHRGGSTP